MTFLEYQIWKDVMDWRDVDSEFTDYAIKVINGEIIAGEALKMTCKRYISFFSRDDLYFDEAAARRPVNFIAKLKFWEGQQFVGKPFLLQDWQKFMVYGMFGFYRKDTGLRLCKNAYIQISRKCGKTSLAAALGLYGLIADGEPGAEIDIVAPSSEQSRLGYKHAKYLAETINKHHILKIGKNNLIEFPHNKSRFRIMSSDSKFGDGFNPTIAIIDEYHAFPNNDIPELLESGMGSRLNSMTIYITTAGFNLDGPCKEYRDMCIDILKGLKTDDTIFPLIYEMDEDDDWTDSACWKKCCPSLHITVREDFMKQRVLKAINSPLDETDIKTKNFNMWCRGETHWIHPDLVKEVSQKFNIEDLGNIDTNLYCYAGIDLAANDDFTSLSLCIPHDNKLYFKTYLFVPSESLKTSRLKNNYLKWKNQGDIIVCDGNVQDYAEILKKLLDIRQKIRIINIGYDKWNTTSFVTNAEYKGFAMEPFYQSNGNYNRPLKEMERLFKMKKIVLDNNSAVRWCFGNVAIHEDVHGNQMPKKAGKRWQKIDAVVSMLMAFGIMIADKGCPANYILEQESILTD